MVEHPAGKDYPDILAQKSLLEQTLKEYKEAGHTWYLLDAKWFKTFKYFVDLESSEHTETAINPGPIDNSLLLDESSNLKPNLVEGLDYVAVSSSTWEALKAWYGLKDNQTTIARKVINVARPPKVDTKLEVYDVCLNIYQSSDFETCSVYNFSNADTISTIERVARKSFQIPDEVTVQLRCFYNHNQSQVLSKDKTIYEESLNSDLKIVVEVIDEENVPNNANLNKSALKDQKKSIPLGNLRNRVNMAKPNNNRAISGTGMATRQTSTSMIGLAEGRGPPCVPGVCGLLNLGNTCFLNSVLQCLSNCGPLTQYFLDGNHEHEINATNPLGKAGVIAKSFADLITMMWSGRHSTVIPQKFKDQLTHFAPQYGGCQQHDAQELLTFLLDGLHEDLNRIKVKPYRHSEEDDLDDDVLARESWEYFLRRNDSIIIENFHGMLKSRVVCPDCEKVSIKFDTFSTLSLPIPLRNDRTISVRYVPYDQSIGMKDFVFLAPKKGTVRDMANELSRFTHIRPEHMVIAQVDKCHFHKFFSMDDPIENINEGSKIFMYNLPEDLVPSLETTHTILPVVFWEVQDLRNKNYLSNMFGTPFLMLLPRGPIYYKTLYDKICERLVRLFEGYLRVNHGCYFMDIETTDDNVNETRETPKFFSPVLVNTYFNEVIRKIPDEEYDVFDVPESFGREVLALQISRQVKQEYYREPQITKVDYSVRPSPNPTLEDCLALFTSTEKLGESNAWHCPRCNMKKRATKKLDLWRLPNILVIHLKRFPYSETRKDKLNTRVEFPLTGLNINDYVINQHKENLVYDLIGVCNHYHHYVSGGHYTAFCKSYRSGTWYCFDDSSFSPIHSESVQSENAYVLFYQRRPTTTNEQSNGEKVDS